MTRYTVSTIIALVVLRLVIGWHFAMEGVYKWHTWWVGKTENSKPFSSEPYFRAATGPVAPLLRTYVVTDPDEQLLAMLEIPGSASDAPSARVPEPIAKSWEDYRKRFIRYYKLDADEAETVKRLEAVKEKLGLWLTTDGTDTKALEAAKLPVPAKREIKKTFPTGTFEAKELASKRIEDFKKKMQAVHELRDVKPWVMGKSVDQPKLAAEKADLAAMRKDLTDDLDLFTKALKDSLSELLAAKLAKYIIPVDTSSDEALLAALTVEPEEKGEDGKPKAVSFRLPKPLLKSWETYADGLDETYQVPPDQRAKMDEALEKAKSSTVAWLLSDSTASAIRFFKDPQQQTPEVIGAGHAMFLVGNEQLMCDLGFLPFIEKDLSRKILAVSARNYLQEEIKSRNEAAKKSLAAAALSEDVSKGYVPEGSHKSWSLIDWIDCTTIILLTTVGLGMLLGFMTRTCCVLAAGFLLTTYLIAPPFPWLPPPPPSEGFAGYVNKNLVEMFALLALATTRSGVWFGLDALVAWCWQTPPTKTKKESGPGRGPGPESPKPNGTPPTQTQKQKMVDPTVRTIVH